MQMCNILISGSPTIQTYSTDIIHPSTIIRVKFSSTFSFIYRKFDTFESNDCDCITPISRSMLDSDWRFSATFWEFTGAGGATNSHRLIFTQQYTNVATRICSRCWINKKNNSVKLKIDYSSSLNHKNQTVAITKIHHTLKPLDFQEEHTK